MFKLQNKKDIVKSELNNSKGLAFKFLENGSIFSIAHNKVMINQLLGSPVEGGLGNIYIRRYHQESISYFPVIGPVSESDFLVGNGVVAWKGQADGLEYICKLQLADDETVWFWNIGIRNITNQTQLIDVVFAQDIGIAIEGAVRSNELYTSQYIDHTVYNDKEYGYVICSRQNQAQDKEFPWIMHGCSNRANGYLTDGFQFFGLDYKETNVPSVLKYSEFPNKNYQYEFAFPTLKSEKIQIEAQENTEVVFFSIYENDHPQITTDEDLLKIMPLVEAFNKNGDKIESNLKATCFQSTTNIFNTAKMFASQDLNKHDLDIYFSPERRHEEQKDEDLMSFFYGPEYHVVLKAKEILSERPHGHMMRSGRDLLPSDDILSVTAWIYGIFNSHITIGNTNLNKMLTISRSPLNIIKSSGQRIFVKTNTGYELLGLPSAFEMGMNSARWIYKGKDTTIFVRTWTSLEDPACFLEISADGTDGLEFLISNNIVSGNLEFETASHVVIDADKKMIELIPENEEPMAEKYPGAKFFMVTKDAELIESIDGDGLLFVDGANRNYPYVVFKTKPVNKFTMAFTGNVLSADRADELADKYTKQLYSYETMLQASQEYWGALCNQAKLSIDTISEEVLKLNDVLHWYSHNAMIHYTTPHGLEQYSGAAWGLRDVCQGPVEFLLATKNYNSLKTVLKMIYSYQIKQTGDWRQWFMFDRYHEIQNSDSHGDIIIWPMKALCDYIEATNDLSILDEAVVFTDDETLLFTEEKATVYTHVFMQIEKIENDCIPGTAMVSYGHGDWEDTLQPADPDMRERMVSTWTVELVYQNLLRYRKVCELVGKYDMAKRLEAFCIRIKEDFNRHLVKDEVVAGLAYFKQEGVDYLLHPGDEKTGIKYRLLPMTRGMISGLFTDEQAKDHLEIIQQNLLFPDGVRLMNLPIAYKGGIERYFKRAETAANFGREIGLQYTHAHIRYIEALAKIGRPEDMYTGMQTINPITVNQLIPTALPRQSNAYFSSSDADFSDRYEALCKFDNIKKSEVGIKGGWRIYSSGPGIYVAQMILNFLGLKEYYSDVLLDPVIPKKLDGLMFDFEYAGKKVRYIYYVKDKGFSPYQVVINGNIVRELRYADNPYRCGGILIPKVEFNDALNCNENRIEIYL